MRLPASLAGMQDIDFAEVRQPAIMQLDYWLHCIREVHSGSNPELAFRARMSASASCGHATKHELHSILFYYQNLIRRGELQGCRQAPF
jgi:hypothetical protein